MRTDERLESKEWERRLKTADGPSYSYSLFLPDRIPEDAKKAMPEESTYESVADYDPVLLLSSSPAQRSLARRIRRGVTPLLEGRAGPVPAAGALPVGKRSRESLTDLSNRGTPGITGVRWKRIQPDAGCTRYDLLLRLLGPRQSGLRIRFRRLRTVRLSGLPRLSGFSRLTRLPRIGPGLLLGSRASSRLRLSRRRSSRLLARTLRARFRSRSLRLSRGRCGRTLLR